MRDRTFRDSEAELNGLLTRISQKIDQGINELTGTARESATREVQRMIDEAFSKVNQMEEDVLLAPGHQRANLANKVHEYNTKIYDLQSSLSNQKLSDQLLGSFSSRPYESQKYRKGLEGLELLNNASQSVDRSLQISAQTEKMGSEVLVDLDSQRQALDRAHSILQTTDVNLSKSRWLIRSINTQLMGNKIFLIGVIVCLSIILILSIYLKFIR